MNFDPKKAANFLRSVCRWPAHKSLCSLALFLVFCSSVSAQSEPADLAKIRSFILEIENAQQKADVGDQELAEFISTATRYRSSVTRCVQTTKATLDKRTEKIQAIQNNVEALNESLQENAAQHCNANQMLQHANQ